MLHCRNLLQCARPPRRQIVKNGGNRQLFRSRLESLCVTHADRHAFPQTMPFQDQLYFSTCRFIIRGCALHGWRWTGKITELRWKSQGTAPLSVLQSFQITGADHRRHVFDGWRSPMPLYNRTVEQRKDHHWLPQSKLKSPDYLPSYWTECEHDIRWSIVTCWAPPSTWMLIRSRFMMQWHSRLTPMQARASTPRTVSRQCERARRLHGVNMNMMRQRRTTNRWNGQRSASSACSRGSSEENEFHICVRVCGVEGRGKSLSGEFFFVCEKDDRGESSTKSLGGMTRPKVGIDTIC